MSDPRTELETPARVLTGIGGLNDRFAALGWQGLFSQLIEDMALAQRRLAAAIDDAAQK
ncbi:hypothetical protein HUO13_01160 [Saccharopolyspora erythraea]|uniref:hypothetical protein n=1 Tax=Saccharopolyspora erythraea TaxID=1836 RepID=UPI001BADCB4F|nr:hypothetical protein [Saccharopolyspora erythraea]QUG99591.1 hypothetical protein HUO13_01160 [Saccharopolyspora erythraea]